MSMLEKGNRRVRGVGGVRVRGWVAVLCLLAGVGPGMGWAQAQTGGTTVPTKPGTAGGAQAGVPGAAAVQAIPAPVERIEVTAYRTPLAVLDSPASTRLLDSAALARAAGVTLDGKLRLVPGFELFRRTSALVANPTTQGLSLRGLGSTAASRTLVISNDVPLNDPYGGWIHWNELPALSISSVEVVRGGASDLYGSSAIGGVVNVIPVRPPEGAAAPRLTLGSSYGAEATTVNDGLATVGRGRYGALFAAGLTATDGYTLIAPALRGPVDVHSNVHAENALVEFDRALGAVAGAGAGAAASGGAGSRVFLRGNVLNEDRHNGTPLTTNATRLWRYAAGADLARLSGRAFGSSERYYQSFSSIAVGRASETLTRTAEDPASELGASVRWTQPVFADTLVIAGGDVRDVRAADYSYPPAPGGTITATTARQRQTGGYGEILSTPGRWTLSGSARVDHFINTDAAQYSATGVKAEPSLSETVVDPRVGISRRITPTVALNASAFRAYRAPTENELYRTGQVGQQTTLANPLLKSERATGWEAGVAAAPRNLGPLGSNTELRGSYFWTQVNRPITALTLTTTPTATTLMRENLGQIESRGVSLDASVHPTVTIAGDGRLTFEGGYQYAVATVTSFAQEPALVGKWIPQVARNAGTLQATVAGERLGLLSLQVRASGRQFDDDQNQYELHSYVRFDVYASHAIGRRVEAFTAVENLLDRSIDAGRTPVRTLGTPQLARFGVRVRLGD